MLPPSLKGHSWFSCTSMPIQWRGGQGKGKGFFQLYLGGGFKYFLFSPRKLGKMNPFWLLLFKGVGSTTNYRYKLYIYMIFPFYYWHLGRLYISYSLGAWSPPHWNVPRHPFLASNFCSASVSAGRWRKKPGDRRGVHLGTDESYGVSGAVRKHVRDVGFEFWLILVADPIVNKWKLGGLDS